jgi:hypothetical protein
MITHRNAFETRAAQCPSLHFYPRAMRMYPSNQKTSSHASTLPALRDIVPVVWETLMRLSFLWWSSEQFRHVC